MPPTDRPESLIRRTLRRRWVPILTQWAILTTVLLCAIPVLLRPGYRASSLLRVDPTPRDLFVAQPKENIDSFLQTQVDLIKSANILTTAGTNPQAATLHRIQTAGDVVLELRKVIQVAIRPGTYLIEVSMTGPSAHEAAVLVNAVVEAFNDSNVEWSGGMTRNQIKGLEAYLNELKNQSTELERRWKDLVAGGDGGIVVRHKTSTGNDEAIRKRFEERLVENDLQRVEALAQLQTLRRVGEAAPVKAAELEARIKTADTLDEALRARLASIPDQKLASRAATDDVEITLLRRSHDDLIKMQETVARRLEQWKYESRGENRIRTVQAAIAPGLPISADLRLAAMILAPFATFAATLTFFAGIEARSARPGPLAG